MPGEDEILAWLRRQLDPGSMIGDDAAFLEPGRRPWAVTVDRQAAGVHFPTALDPAWFARRLLAVNLSDLAAVGAEPRYAFLVLAVPDGFDYRRFFRSLLRACRQHGLDLAGGDLSRAGEAEATLTLVGRRPAGCLWLRRSSARSEDRLWVGGTLGEAAIGLELVRRGALPSGRGIALPGNLPPSLHAVARRAVRRQLQPRPQLELGQWLAAQRPPPAAIDVSDGLALDLRRLCRASGVGAIVRSSALPKPPHLEPLARALSLEPQDLVLGGGEDYVLLFSLPASSRPPTRFRCHCIGSITSGNEVLLRDAKGELRPMPRLGWDHFRE